MGKDSRDSLWFIRAFGKAIRYNRNPFRSAGQSCGKVFLSSSQVNISISPHFHRLKNALSNAVLWRLRSSRESSCLPLLTEVRKALHEDLIIHYLRVVAARLGILREKNVIWRLSSRSNLAIKSLTIWNGGGPLQFWASTKRGLAACRRGNLIYLIDDYIPSTGPFSLTIKIREHNLRNILKAQRMGSN